MYDEPSLKPTVGRDLRAWLQDGRLHLEVIINGTTLRIEHEGSTLLVRIDLLGQDERVIPADSELAKIIVRALVQIDGQLLMTTRTPMATDLYVRVAAS